MEKIDFKIWTNNKIQAEIVIQRRIFKDAKTDDERQKASDIINQCWDEGIKRRIIADVKPTP